jgi:hypothetical protein
MVVSTSALVLVLLFQGGGSGSPQQRPRQSPPAHQHETTYCGHTTSVLDGLTQHSEPGELIIVIARRGTGEGRPDLIRRRLHNVKTHLVQVGGRSPETVLVAEGERVEGYGRLQFYIGGKLVEDLKIKRNSDLYVGTCYPEPGEDECKHGLNKMFYPCLDRSRGRR